MNRYLAPTIAVGVSLLAGCGADDSKEFSPRPQIQIFACEDATSEGTGLDGEQIYDLNHILNYAQVLAIKATEAVVSIGQALPGGEIIQPATFPEPASFQSTNINALVCADSEGRVLYFADSETRATAGYILGLLQENDASGGSNWKLASAAVESCEQRTDAINDDHIEIQINCS